jgi:hypothetical protein
MPVGIIFVAGKPFVVLHGTVDTAAFSVELPSIDDAANAALLNETSHKIHPSVSAKASKEPQLAGRLTDQHKLFSEVAYWEGA